MYIVARWKNKKKDWEMRWKLCARSLPAQWGGIVIKRRLYYDCHMLWLIIGTFSCHRHTLLSVIWLMYFEFYLIFVIGFHDSTYTHKLHFASRRMDWKLDLSLMITIFFSLSISLVLTLTLFKDVWNMLFVFFFLHHILNIKRMRKREREREKVLKCILSGILLIFIW
jgi:hypothetical protein